MLVGGHWQRVAVGDIVVRHLEGDGHHLPIGILTVDLQFIGLIVHLRYFCAREVVGLIHLVGPHGLDRQTVLEIPDISLESQDRLLNHQFSVIINCITDLAITLNNSHLQFPVR